MKKLLSWMLLLCLMTSLLPAALGDEAALTRAEITQTFEQGEKAVRGSVKVVSLTGTWDDMGRQYGALMKEELEEVYGFVQAILQSSVGNADIANSIVETQTRQTPYRIEQFFAGAAETSGLTVQQLQEVNAVERIGGLPQCSAAICWGDYAADKLIVGRNYDYSDIFMQLKDDVAVTVYHPADGALATATIGYAGEIYAVNALNEKGVFLELNNGTPSTSIKSPHARISGTTLLLNCMFEADSVEDLDLYFHTMMCSSSYIINAADARQARSYEWCPIGVLQAEDSLEEGLIASSNYFVHPDWPFDTPTDEACWEGLTRRANLIDLCQAAKGSIDAQRMMDIIGTSLEDGGAMNPLTVYQLVVEPETLTLWLRVIGASDWVEIDMGSFLLPQT